MLSFRSWDLRVVSYGQAPSWPVSSMWRHLNPPCSPAVHPAAQTSGASAGWPGHRVGRGGAGGGGPVRRSATPGLRGSVERRVNAREREGGWLRELELFIVTEGRANDPPTAPRDRRCEV